MWGSIAFGAGGAVKVVRNPASICLAPSWRYTWKFTELTEGMLLYSICIYKFQIPLRERGKGGRGKDEWMLSWLLYICAKLHLFIIPATLKLSLDVLN